MVIKMDRLWRSNRHENKDDSQISLRIMKFNKWSVVKFIFHRLVRYNEDDFICENPWHITNEDLVP